MSCEEINLDVMQKQSMLQSSCEYRLVYLFMTVSRTGALQDMIHASPNITIVGQ